MVKQPQRQSKCHREGKRREEDPRCLGSGGYQRHHLYREDYGSNVIGFTI